VAAEAQDPAAAEDMQKLAAEMKTLQVCLPRRTPQREPGASVHARAG